MVYNLKPDLIKFTVAAIVFIALIILVTLSIIYGRKHNLIDNHFKCEIEFERTTQFESILGNFTKFVIAADNVICSTVGK